VPLIIWHPSFLRGVTPTSPMLWPRGHAQLLQGHYDGSRERLPPVDIRVSARRVWFADGCNYSPAWTRRDAVRVETGSATRSARVVTYLQGCRLRLLSPVYTIQPVVKPVVQPGLTTGYIVKRGFRVGTHYPC